MIVLSWAGRESSTNWPAPRFYGHFRHHKPGLLWLPFSTNHVSFVTARFEMPGVSHKEFTQQKSTCTIQECFGLLATIYDPVELNNLRQFVNLRAIDHWFTWSRDGFVNSSDVTNADILGRLREWHVHTCDFVVYRLCIPICLYTYCILFVVLYSMPYVSWLIIIHILSRAVEDGNCCETVR